MLESDVASNMAMRQCASLMAQLNGLVQFQRIEHPLLGTASAASIN